jgi:hypothetical protein
MSRKKPKSHWLEQPRDEQGRFARAAKPTRRTLGRSRHPATAKSPAKAARPVAKKPPVKAARPVAKKLPVKKPPVKAARPVAKKLPVKKLPAKAARPVAKKLPVKKPPVKVARPVAKKPPVKAARPVAKKAPVKVARPRPKKPPVRQRPKKSLRDELGRFISPKKLPRLPRKPPAPRPPRKPELPLIAERSRAAEVDMQVRLIHLQDSIILLEAGLDMAVQTMVNRDGTVDGELTIRNLPDEWRDARTMGRLVATLSSALRTFEPFAAHPKMGGGFWCSFGVRFGPQNEAEIGEMYNLYKRHRGLFQIGTYPTPAWGTGALQVALVGNNVGLRAMLDSLMKKRGLPPSVVMIRFIWTPDGQRPGHYKGEK